MRIVTLDTCPSTNTCLLDDPAFLSQNFLVLRAVVQTAGRGRHGRGWISGEGRDLTFSFVFHPSAGSPSAAVTVLAGIGILRALSPYDQRIVLKWPNDLLAQGRKLAGILVERTLLDGKDVLVVGIGLNVNSKGSELDPGAISLSELTGQSHSVESILDTVFSSVKSLLESTPVPVPEQVISEFLRASSILGRKVRFSDDSVREGIVTGMSGSCSLMISCDGKEIEYTGESEILP